jgi:hypothetical protein
MDISTLTNTQIIDLIKFNPLNLTQTAMENLAKLRAEVIDALAIILIVELDIDPLSYRVRDLMLKLLENHEKAILIELMKLVTECERGFQLIDEFTNDLRKLNNPVLILNYNLIMNDLTSHKEHLKMVKEVNDSVESANCSERSKLSKDKMVYSGYFDAWRNSEGFKEYKDQERYSENSEKSENKRKKFNLDNFLKDSKKIDNEYPKYPRSSLYDKFGKSDKDRIPIIKNNELSVNKTQESFIDNLSISDIQSFKPEPKQEKYFSNCLPINHVNVLDQDIELWTAFLSSLNDDDWQLLYEFLDQNLKKAVGYNKVKLIYPIVEALLITDDLIRIDILGERYWDKIKIESNFKDLPLTVRMMEIMEVYHV